ncbi:MAG: 23S rRNA (uracil(1939)-C(5))-methyltransferase RlmD [Clostridia bacterium]|nr:23S rRNA (uracil(1939)-C(5))-methyltransferase RlmD [Clostridia bacterium]
MKKNDVYKVSITDVTSEGVGICRVDGAAVFVQNALKDEIHNIKIVKTTKNISYGKTIDIEKRSPYRCESNCEVSGKCGGCTFRHVSYEGQLAIKQNVVETALKRIGHTDVPVEKIVPTSPDHYRNKAQYPVGTDENGKMCFGFYAKNSHDIVTHKSCLLHDKSFYDIASALIKIFEMNRLSSYDEIKHTGLIRHITMRKTVSGDIAVCVVINGVRLPQANETAKLIMKLFPQIKSFYVNENKEKTNVIFGNKYTKIAGDKYLTETICGKKLSFTPSSFLQVNAEGAEKLYEKAKEYLDLKDGDRLIDLYCGVGSVGICTAGNGKVFGVEINPDAVEDARYNSLQNGRKDDEYVCADAKDALKIVNGKEYQALVIDPPRKGIDKELIEDIAATGIEKVVYISCDPATLARDIAIFETKGYKAVKACPVDMFPGTGHVETIVLLSRAWGETTE